jgi:hypothetical protein
LELPHTNYFARMAASQMIFEMMQESVVEVNMDGHRGIWDGDQT